MCRKVLTLLLALSLLLVYTAALAEGSWICPGCGRENPERANFCGSCRSPKPSGEITAEAASNAWVCSQCGDVCPDGDAFCMMCGNDHHETDERAILVPESTVSDITFPAAQILPLEGVFRQNDEERSYEYTAPVTGSYRIFVKTADSGFQVRVRVLDLSDYVLGSDYLKQGQGYDVELQAGNRYIIKAIQNRDLGAFTVGVGIPREPGALENNRSIHDSMSFTDQDNQYILQAQTSGVYRFWVYQANSGFSTRVRVFDKQGYVLGSDYVKQNQGISVELAAGEIYTVHAIQHNDLGEYQLRIGCPKTTTDISGCLTVGDDISFTDQENTYTFTATESGVYVVQLAKAMKGFSARVRVFDQGGYVLGSDYLKQGGNYSVELKAGSIYTVKVIQHNEYGAYCLRITH